MNIIDIIVAIIGFGLVVGAMLCPDTMIEYWFEPAVFIIILIVLVAFLKESKGRK